MTVESTSDGATDRQTVIIWSGGADSTMLLTEHAHASSAAKPIRALTVDAHYQLDSKFMESQRLARARYLKWAKRQGYHVDHAVVTVSQEGGAWICGGGQETLWMCHLAPYLPKQCRVLFGYIARDGFWHRRAEHEAVMLALQNHVEGDWEIGYPYEWSEKGSILSSLSGWKVPKNCWWTCEEPRESGKTCKGRSCNKCREHKAALETISKVSSKGVVTAMEPERNPRKRKR